MIFELQDAWDDMLIKQHEFNEVWKPKVVAAQVWCLPVKDTAQTAAVITPEKMEGATAVAMAERAILQFETVGTQHPGTVMRLPGWIGVDSSVLAAAQIANQARQAFLHVLAIETQKVDLKTMSKGKYARALLKRPVVLKQIERRIQVFDGIPRRILFTWAGNTAAPEKVPVGVIIEKLQIQLEEAIQAEDIPREQQRQVELKSISNLPEDAVLHRYRRIAPHPRVMLYFGKEARYDAMPHANLPVFVIMDEKAPWPRVDGLSSFYPEKARRQRADKLARISVIPRLDLYLQVPTEACEPAANFGLDKDSDLIIASTYNAER